jgi:hypothetical protein
VPKLRERDFWNRCHPANLLRPGMFPWKSLTYDKRAQEEGMARG